MCRPTFKSEMARPHCELESGDGIFHTFRMKILISRLVELNS